MAKAFIPGPGKILVRPEKKKDRSEGGIFLPDNAQRKSNKGEVVGVGAAKVSSYGYRETHPFFTGQKVVFLAHGGWVVEHEGEDLVVLSPDDILGTVTED